MAGSAPSSGTIAKLVHEANLIGRFFIAQPRGDPAAGVADHLRRFWAPSLRSALAAYAQAGGAGLEPVSRQGLLMLANAPPPRGSGAGPSRPPGEIRT
jgi:formate dehydrogenase subunit delta